MVCLSLSVPQKIVYCSLIPDPAAEHGNETICSACVEQELARQNAARLCNMRMLKMTTLDVAKIAEQKRTHWVFKNTDPAAQVKYCSSA